VHCRVLHSCKAHKSRALVLRAMPVHKTSSACPQTCSSVRRTHLMYHKTSQLLQHVAVCQRALQATMLAYGA
jgi:hypothetical protein